MMDTPDLLSELDEFQEEEVSDSLVKKVEDYLNEISYKDINQYLPTEFALEFVNFIKLVNGEQQEEHKSPVLHFRMLDTVVSGDTRIANMCFRGSAKTTLMAEYLILYLAVHGSLPNFGMIDLGLYVSDSIENGVKNMRKNLEFRWENSDFLKTYVPKTRFTDIRWEFENVEGKKLVFKGYGAQTGVRGAKEMGTRPKIALLDDLISDEDARSTTVISAIEDTVYKAVTYALHPSRNMIIWSGTPFNAKDPLYKAVESGGWQVNVFPVCEEFPCSRADFRSSWPDRFNYDYVARQYKTAMLNGKVDTFNQEMMLRIMSAEDRLVQDEEIRWYKRETLLANRGKFNFYITTDFATSKEQSSDLSVISVWAYNNVGSWFWVDGICKRQLMDTNVEKLFYFAQKYRPQSTGIEISGQQKGFVSWISSQMIERNIYFTLACEGESKTPGFRPSTNKLVRFNTVVPMFKAGKMYFPEEMRHTPIMQEMINEVSLVTNSGIKSKKDDFLDTISMLSLMKPWKPSEEAAVVPGEDDSGMWELEMDDEDENPRESYIV